MLNAELVARSAVTRNELQRHAYVHHLEEHLQLTVSGGGAAGPEAAVLLVRGALMTGRKRWNWPRRRSG
jgi:hypothetical protein